MDHSVEVSIVCCVYNHEKYLEKALQGFINQVTDFKYEIIIHDDASTDKSADIIREYALKYHNIKPIYQKENQYSQNISIAKEFIIPQINGKYVALCEGDDYWIDCKKLQKQYDFMENHPNIAMTTHGYNMIRANSGELIQEYHCMNSSGYFTFEHLLSNLNIPQTATFFMRKSVYVDRLDKFIPCPVGDFQMRLYAFLEGGVYYDDCIMSVYRIASDNSWTVRIRRNKEKYLEFLKDFKSFHLKLRELYPSFINDIDFAIESIDFDILVCKKDKNALYTNYFKSLSLKGKLKTLFQLFCPELYALLLKHIK